MHDSMITNRGHAPPQMLYCPDEIKQSNPAHLGCDSLDWFFRVPAQPSTLSALLDGALPQYGAYVSNKARERSCLGIMVTVVCNNNLHLGQVIHTLANCLTCMVYGFCDDVACYRQPGRSTDQITFFRSASQLARSVRCHLDYQKD